ncbi:Uma2 family endonuclease [Streptomyces sp. NPDC090741]|uniref:Uma2 family endonuclease n=1 Tax=Streptomyces sp. NPDC090741 TaxID=3365967 RepID=UPI00381CB50C
MGQRWPRPPVEGYVVEDLLALPGLPRHTEPIDGSLVFSAPQSVFHSTVTDLLGAELRRCRTSGFRVVREAAVVPDRRNGLVPDSGVVPDIGVVRASACTGRDQWSYPVADTVLVVEVVSPDSEARDIGTKPHRYAAAGIPSFWRVESRESGPPPVHLFRLDPVNRSYAHTGAQRGVVTTGVPFRMEIDLTRVDELL